MGPLVSALAIGSSTVSTPAALSRTPAVTMSGGKIASKNVWVPITEYPEKGEIVSGFKYNVEVAVANDGGSLYGFINKMPPTGQPVTFATIEDKCLVEPITKTKFSLRTGKVEALINVNAKAQFEQKYWRGVLDAQGKVDGGYY